MQSVFTWWRHGAAYLIVVSAPWGIEDLRFPFPGASSSPDRTTPLHPSVWPPQFWLRGRPPDLLGERLAGNARRLR